MSPLERTVLDAIADDRDPYAGKRGASVGAVSQAILRLKKKRLVEVKDNKNVLATRSITVLVTELHTHPTSLWLKDESRPDSNGMGGLWPDAVGYATEAGDRFLVTFTPLSKSKTVRPTKNPFTGKTRKKSRG